MSVAGVFMASCAAAILWVLFVYPLWLACRARFRSDPGRPAVTRGNLASMTAIVPVHNGADFLERKLRSILASDYPAERLDVIVVSDGSTDETERLAEQFVATGRVRILSLPKSGKAAALTASIRMVTAELILLTDVRQVLDADCARILAGRLADPRVGVVSGTLRIRAGETLEESYTGLYWKYESWIRKNLSRIDSLLGATGPVYVIRRSLARDWPADCILDDVWQPMQIVLEGYRAILADDAIVWDYPTSMHSEFNRKVRTQAGIYQLLRMDPRLIQPARNRLFWPFVNLKLGRLLLGHLLIAIAIATLFLDPPARWVLLASQGLFYGASLVDRLLSEDAVLKRITSPIAAFVSLVAAAFLGQMILFRSPAELWKSTKVRLSANQFPKVPGQ